MTRNAASTAGLLAVALFVVLASPATAAITTAALTATTPSYTGKCAVTETFSGTISGMVGTTFQYSFNRFINGAQQIQNIGSGTIPASGSLAVNDSFSIASSSTGANFDQIWVHNIAGGQADVYSNKATFAVTCASVNPNAVLHQGTTLVKPVVTLHSQWWALREYEYKWVGMTTYLPERGTGPCGNLCIGWYHLHNGDSFYLYHWNTYDRAFLGFDPTALNGLNVTKATLTLKVVQGDPNCYGGLGRALLAKIPAAKFTSQTFNAPYPEDGDFNWPTPTQFSAGSATVDVTSIIQQWASGKMRNDGFVLRGKVEDNGSNGNDSCSLGFATDGVLTITQQ
jgi:hypothetical protein